MSKHPELIRTFESIVGKPHVLTKPDDTLAYRQGFRFGKGEAIAVVKPGTLLEQWKVLEACEKADVIVITQASNTGITGGSTPYEYGYDRDVVIISTRRIDKIHLINNNEQAVCLSGTTLFHLEGRLTQVKREVHSVIGSSCIGASVIGGVCNNSGGALIQRGPAYTEMSLFARINVEGELELVNHLGIDLGNTPEEILTRLEKGQFTQADIENSKAGHDATYIDHVRKVDEPTAARYNADPRLLCDASGCAGRIMVFAVRMDTFPLEERTQVFYVGVPTIHELTDIRREMLSNFKQIPILGEYLHKDTFDLADQYGKDMFWSIKNLGTDSLPGLFELKGKVDRFCERSSILPDKLSEKVLQLLGKLLPDHLPKRMRAMRTKFDHHLIIKMGGDGVDEAREFFKTYFADHPGEVFECTPEESKAALLHRFVAAGAAGRYRAVHEDTVEDLVALDIALPRNERDWLEVLPEELRDKFVHVLYYGHFFCHVFHQDYLAKKGTDTHALKEALLKIQDARNAQYPAEHNVGHLYEAKPSLVSFYRRLDPTNTFNPGIGKTSRNKNWA